MACIAYMYAASVNASTLMPDHNVVSHAVRLTSQRCPAEGTACLAIQPADNAFPAEPMVAGRGHLDRFMDI
jgi:hypothetical protein